MKCTSDKFSLVVCVCQYDYINDITSIIRQRDAKQNRVAVVLVINVTEY